VGCLVAGGGLSFEDVAVEAGGDERSRVSSAFLRRCDLAARMRAIFSAYRGSYKPIAT
jgi:hypothetical protein